MIEFALVIVILLLLRVEYRFSVLNGVVKERASSIKVLEARLTNHGEAVDSYIGTLVGLKEVVRKLGVEITALDERITANRDLSETMAGMVRKNRELLESYTEEVAKRERDIVTLEKQNDILLERDQRLRSGGNRYSVTDLKKKIFGATKITVPE